MSVIRVPLTERGKKCSSLWGNMNSVLVTLSLRSYISIYLGEILDQNKMVK